MILKEIKLKLISLSNSSLDLSQLVNEGFFTSKSAFENRLNDQICCISYFSALLTRLFFAQLLKCISGTLYAQNDFLFDIVKGLNLL